MSTTNNVFVDSSILVEFIKGRKTKLLTSLIDRMEVIPFISETVVSEFLLYFLAINGNASPRSLHGSAKIASIFNAHLGYDLLQRFSFLPNSDELFSLTPYFMKTYNLLPNDAIILATCMVNNITKLASHDSDLIIPCKAEGIELLREEEL